MCFLSDSQGPEASMAALKFAICAQVAIAKTSPAGASRGGATRWAPSTPCFPGSVISDSR